MFRTKGGGKNRTKPPTLLGMGRFVGVDEKERGREKEREREREREREGERHLHIFQELCSHKSNILFICFWCSITSYLHYYLLRDSVFNHFIHTNNISFRNFGAPMPTSTRPLRVAFTFTPRPSTISPITTEKRFSRGMGRA